MSDTMFSNKNKQIIIAQIEHKAWYCVCYKELRHRVVFICSDIINIELRIQWASYTYRIYTSEQITQSSTSNNNQLYRNCQGPGHKVTYIFIYQRYSLYILSLQFYICLHYFELTCSYFLVSFYRILCINGSITDNYIDSNRYQ